MSSRNLMIPSFPPSPTTEGIHSSSDGNDDDGSGEDDDDDRKPAALPTTAIRTMTSDEPLLPVNHDTDDEDENDNQDDSEDQEDGKEEADDATSDQDDDDGDGDDDNDNDDCEDDNDNDDHTDDGKDGHHPTKDDGLSDYERLREERIRRNQEYLARLGLDDATKKEQKRQQQQQQRKWKQQQQQPSQQQQLLPQRHSLGRASKSKTMTYSDEIPLKQLLGSSRGGSLPSSTNTNTQQPQRSSNHHHDDEKKKKQSKSHLESRVPWVVHREFMAIGKRRRDRAKKLQRHIKASLKHVQYFQKLLTKFQKHQQRRQQQQTNGSTTTTTTTMTKRQIQWQKEREQLNGKTLAECLQELDKKKQQLWKVVVDYEKEEKKAAKAAQIQQQQEQLRQKQVQFQIKLDYVDTWQIIPAAYSTIARSLAVAAYEHAPPDPPPPRRSSRAAADEDPTNVVPQHLRTPPYDLSSSSSSLSVVSPWQRLVQTAYAQHTLTSKQRTQQEPPTGISHTNTNNTNTNSEDDHPRLASTTTTATTSAPTSEDDNKDLQDKVQSMIRSITTNRALGSLSNNPSSSSSSLASWISPFLAQQLDRDWMMNDYDDDNDEYHHPPTTTTTNNNKKKKPTSNLRRGTTFHPQVGNLVLYYPGAHMTFLHHHPDVLGQTSGSRLRRPLWERAHEAAAATTTIIDTATTPTDPTVTAPSPRSSTKDYGDLPSVDTPNPTHPSSSNGTPALDNAAGSTHAMQVDPHEPPAATNQKDPKDTDEDMLITSELTTTTATTDNTATTALSNHRSRSNRRSAATATTATVSDDSSRTQAEAMVGDVEDENDIEVGRTVQATTTKDSTTTSVPIPRRRGRPPRRALAEAAMNQDATCVTEVGEVVKTRGRSRNSQMTTTPPFPGHERGQSSDPPASNEIVNEEVTTNPKRKRRADSMGPGTRDLSPRQSSRRHAEIASLTLTHTNAAETRRRSASAGTRDLPNNDDEATATARRIAPRSSRFQGTFKIPTESVRDLFHGSAVSAKIGTKKEELRKLIKERKRARSAPPVSKHLGRDHGGGRPKFSIRKLKKIIIKVGKTLTMELDVPRAQKKPQGTKRRRSDMNTIDPFPDDVSENDEEIPLASTAPEFEPIEIDPDETVDGEHEIWWTEEWLSGIHGDLGRYPILCRVEQAHAEFPQDPTKKKVDKYGNVTWITPPSSTERGTTQYLRLCLKLQPLTPVLPPERDEVSGSIQVDTTLPVPPKFSVATFPSEVTSPFLVPFAGAFAANHSLTLGDTVEGTHNGKIAGFSSIGNRFGSCRLDDKVHTVRSILQRLKEENPSAVLGLDSPQKLPEADAAFLVEFLSVFLEERTSYDSLTDISSATNHDPPSLLDLVRCCLPIFNGIGLRREAFHRKVSYACVWDIELKKNRKQGFRERSVELMTQRLSNCIPSTLSDSLRAKIRFSIQHFLDSRPEAEGFASMVSEEDAPSYYCAVPTAMYFDLILARLESGNCSGRCFYTSPESVLSDIQTILINCRLYNSRQSPLVTVCSSLIPALQKHLAMLILRHNQDCANKTAAGTTGSELTLQLDADTCNSILRCFDVLKRRCLNGTAPDSCDERYRLNSIMRGAIPSSQGNIGIRSLPTFEELLTANENSPIDENAMTTRGVRKGEDDSVTMRLAHNLYLPPWVIDAQQDHRTLGQPSDDGSKVSSSTLCLELIRIRLKTGYYQDRASIVNDLKEACVSSLVNVLSGPASRPKKRISAKKITRLLCLVAPKSALHGERETIDADESDVLLSEEEQALFSRLERAQKLYTMAILAVKETDHVERLFGFVPKALLVASHANNANDESSEIVVGNPEIKAAARRIRYLLAATGRETCQNTFTKFGALKVTVTVGGEKIRLKHTATNTILSSFSFGFDDFLANDNLAFALLKRPGKRAPCARCQIFGHTFYACRVVRGHSNPDFDFMGNWKESGGVEGLLAPFIPADSVQGPQPHENVAEAIEVGGDGSDGTSVPVAQVQANGLLSAEATVTGESREIINANVASRDDNTIDLEDPSEYLAKAQEILQTARQLDQRNEALSTMPPRLGKDFIKSSFPIDESDGRYIWCTICGLSGDVLCCDGCANVVHPACVGLHEVPEGDWFCEECKPIQIERQGDGLTHAESEDRATTNGFVPGVWVAPTDDDLDFQIEAMDMAMDELYAKRFPDGEPVQKTKIQIGTVFFKMFDGGRYKGTVHSLPSDAQPYLHVKYDDGDSEDMEEEEILQLLENPPDVNQTHLYPQERPRKNMMRNQDDKSESARKRSRYRADMDESPAISTRGRLNQVLESDTIRPSERGSRASRDSRATSRCATDRKTHQAMATPTTVVILGRKGWSDEENDLFFDGITKFKASKIRDDRWQQIADTIHTKTRKQVFDQLYWFFVGSRENAHKAYLERKGPPKKKKAMKANDTETLAVSQPNESTRSRRGRPLNQESDNGSKADNSDDDDSRKPPRRGRPPKRDPDDNGKGDDPKPAAREKAVVNKGKWTDSEYDLLFDGIEKFDATLAPSDAWDKIASSIQTRPRKQVMDQLHSYFKGYRDKAFREFCERRGFLALAPLPRCEDSSSESDDDTPPPSEQKRRGPVNVFRINPLPPRERSRSMASAASSLSDDDWEAPSNRKRGKGRTHSTSGSAGRRVQEAHSETAASSYATPSGRKPRRCIRCLEFNGKYSLDCRGRKGHYGQVGCEFFTSNGTPLKSKPSLPKALVIESSEVQRDARKRARSESPLPLPTDALKQGGNRTKRRRRTESSASKVKDHSNQDHSPTSSGRKPRRCLRCLKFNGKYALDCRGRKGYFGQQGCEYFSSVGKPLKK